jgi:hypothetical protein
VSDFSTAAPLIIAAVPVRALPPGATIEAEWTYNNTSLDAFTTKLTTSSAAHQSWIAFRLERAPDVPWPSGVYAVTVSLDGVPLQESSIEVVDHN